MCKNPTMIEKSQPPSTLGSMKAGWDWCWEIAHESYQVARPAMGLVASTLYLYNNEEATLVKALYFAFFFQMSSNAGNDYMDWERDHEEEDREYSCSRGKAKTKQRVWWYYMFATIVAGVISMFDPTFGILYLVVHEFCGQLLYNGIFFGVPVHEISIVKRTGFPLDVPVAAWWYMPFPHLIAIESFFPTWTVSMWGTTMIWAQLKDYEHEKNTKVQTTATVLGPTLTKLLIAGSGCVMMYLDPRLSLYGVYTCYSCWAWPNKVGKMSVFMGLNLFIVVCLDPKVDAFVKFTTFGIQLLAMIWHYVIPNEYTKSQKKEA